MAALGRARNRVAIPDGRRRIDNAATTERAPKAHRTKTPRGWKEPATPAARHTFVEPEPSDAAWTTVFPVRTLHFQWQLLHAPALLRASARATKPRDPAARRTSPRPTKLALRVQ